jgi:TonB family protein
VVEEAPAEEEKKEEVAKKESKPAPTERKELEEKVAKTGLLKVLGSIGTSGGAFEDVLGAGTGAADIAEALAGAGGVGVATADAIAAGGQRGGGTGTQVGIGDLGTAGGGKVDLGPKGDAKISGRVRDAAPEVDSTEVDRDALGRYVRGRVKSIVACYEKELKRNPSLKGKVVVTWTITPGGRSSGVEIEENSMGSDAVSACIRTVIRSWVFPFKPESEVTVSYPFVFTPSS